MAGWLRRVSPSGATHAFNMHVPTAWRAGFALQSFCGLVAVNIDNARRDHTTARCELCVRAVNRTKEKR